MKFLIDEVLLLGNKDLLIWLFISYTSLIVFRMLLKFLQSYIFNFLSSSILFKIRFDLFNHLQKLDHSFFKKTKIGDIISRLEGDVSQIQYFTTDLFIGVVSDVINLFFIFIILLTMNYKLATMTLLILPFFYYLSVYYRKKIKYATKEFRSKTSELLTFYQEFYQGYEVIKMSSLEKPLLKKFIKFGRSLISLQINRAVLTNITSTIVNFFSIIFPMMLLFGGGYFVIKGELTIGLLMAYYAYVIKIFAPFHRLARTNIALQGVLVSVERIFDFLESKPQIYDNGVAKKINNFNECIMLEDVCFYYNNDKDMVLNNLNLTINKGQKVAFIGESGHGKSTIINLLSRFYDPISGFITIDKKDFKSISLKSLRDQFSIVAQSSYLFNASIKENFKYIKENITDEEIMSACKIADIYDYIESLPDKLNTIIGDNGTNLSGGQRQKLCIARAIIKNSPIYIFDEATSNLDNKSEYIVRKNIQKHLSSKTIIYIAHRLSTIINCDEIFVLNCGNLEARGKHDDLLKISRTYKRLWELQNKKESRI